jgi:phage shock protein A
MAAAPDFRIPDNDNDNNFLAVVNEKLGGLEQYVRQQNQAEGLRIDQINQMLAEIKRKIRELQQRLAESGRQAGDIGRNIKINNNTVQLNERRIRELEAEKQRLEQQLAENQRRIGELTRGIEEAKNRGDGRRAAELAAQLVNLQNQNKDALAGQAATAGRNIEELRQQIVDLELENAALQAKYNDLMAAMKRAFRLLEQMNNRRPTSNDLNDMFVKIQSINRLLDGAGAPGGPPELGPGAPPGAAERDARLRGRGRAENVNPLLALGGAAGEDYDLYADPRYIQDNILRPRGGRKTTNYKKRGSKKAKTVKKRVESRKQKGGYLIKSKHRHKTHSRHHHRKHH